MPVYVDVEGLVRMWVQSAIPDVAVHFSLPTTDPVSLPVILVTRVGGSASGPLDQPLIQFDCFGSNKHQAAAVAYLLASALEELNQPGASRALLGADDIQIRSYSDVNDKVKRYIVEARVTLRQA